MDLNHLIAGPDYIRVFFHFLFIKHIKCQLLKMLMIKRDINQHDFKIVDPQFIKSE